VCFRPGGKTSDSLLEQRINIKFCAKLGKSESKTLQMLTEAYGAARRRRPELWPDAWILHHYNALAHDVLAVWEFLAKKLIIKLEHPPYSPDLAPCDFWLFPKLKAALKGHRFSDIADIQGHATTIMQSIPEEEFQKCFEQCKHQLTKCIGVQGDYFEGGSNH
jgi:transposase